MLKSAVRSSEVMTRSSTDSWRSVLILLTQNDETAESGSQGSDRIPTRSRGLDESLDAKAMEV